MRPCLVIAAAALVLSGAATAAEARARGGRSVSVSVSRPAAPVKTAALGAGIGTTLSLRGTNESAEAGPAPKLRPVVPVAAPVREASGAAPWCSDKRIVGSGAGFCEIN